MSLSAALRNPITRGAFIGGVCAVAAWLLSQTTLIRGLEEWMLDSSFAYRGTRPTSAKIVLIGMDDESLDKIKKPLVYTSPELAKVVNFVKARGAAAIGLDVLVPESASGFQGLEAEVFGKANEFAGNVVLAKWRLRKKWLLPIKIWWMNGREEYADLGFVNTSPDKDKFLRRQQLVIREGDQAHTHFALTLLSVAKSADIRWKEEELFLGDRPVPLDKEQKLRINYVGPAETFEVTPFHEFLFEDAEARLSSLDLEDAIVIVGVSAHSQGDYHPTPYANSYFNRIFGKGSGQMSGIEFHANVIATLADRAFIVQPIRLSSLPALLFVGVLIGIAYVKLDLIWGVLLMLAHYFSWKGAAITAFIYWNWHLEVIGMLIMGFLTYGAVFSLRWRQMRKMMGLFKSEAVAKAMETDPTRLDLKGEEREITILFSDIRSFTTFSEENQPHHVVKLLNEYFSAIVPIIEENGGIVNQYMGDGIMVLFGAPAHSEDHAAQAVSAAVEMVKHVHQLKEKWSELGWQDMRIGVGIHVGTCVIGTIGSRRRLDYTAIGDSVNTASRIESENKEQGTEILISSDVYDCLSIDETSEFAVSDPVSVTVKGKGEPILVYPVIVT